MAANTYLIQYGSLQLAYKRMTVTQTPRYGDNGIDQTGIKYDFRVRGWLTSPTQEGFATLICQTKSILAQPRQTFKVKWSEDGITYQTLYDFEETGNGVGDDIAWGPMPGPLSITEFVNGKAAMYEWSLSVESKLCFGDCSTGPDNAPTYVLTWSRSYDSQIGPDGLTTQTVSGRLEVTSSGVVAGFPADSYRYLVTPACPTNFKREGQSFKQSADGRFLDYSITDKEAVWTLPPPITTGNATWTVNIPMVYSRMAEYRLAGTFTAPPTTPKSAIIEQILQLCSNRMSAAVAGAAAAAAAGGGKNALILGGKSLEESVYGNSVTFSFSASGPVGATDDPTDPNTGYASFGSQPPGSAGGLAQQIGFFGGDGTNNSGVAAGIPSVYDACNPVFPGGGGGNGRSLNANTTTPGGDPTSVVPTDPTRNGSLNKPPPPFATPQAHLDNPWFMYKETISWTVNNGKKLFYPKVAGLAPLVQQTRNPKMTIIQIGHAERYAQSTQDAPPFATPLYPEPTVSWLEMNQTTHDPAPVGASTWSLYAVSWSYVMEWTAALRQSPITIKFSQDPRSSATPAQLVVNNPPKIISPPDQ